MRQITKREEIKITITSDKRVMGGTWDMCFEGGGM